MNDNAQYFRHGAELGDSKDRMWEQQNVPRESRETGADTRAEQKFMNGVAAIVRLDGTGEAR
jgi:hypothetical protein